MAITQQQVDDWFKANPNATPEQVAQTVQGLGGLAANNGLADLIGKQYGMSGTNIGSIYDTLTYQPTMANSQPQQATPVTSIEQMKSNTAQWNALEDYAKKSPSSIVENPWGNTEADKYFQLSRDASLDKIGTDKQLQGYIDPAITKRFVDQYRFANSSQARDAFSDPRTYSTDFVPTLIEKGVSPEAIARYSGIPVERASQIYNNALFDDLGFASAVTGGGIKANANTQYHRVPEGFVVTEPNKDPMLYSVMGKLIGPYSATPPKGIAALAANNPYLSKMFSAIKKD